MVFSHCPDELFWIQTNSWVVYSIIVQQATQLSAHVHIFFTQRSIMHFLPVAQHRHATHRAIFHAHENVKRRNSQINILNAIRISLHCVRSREKLKGSLVKSTRRLFIYTYASIVRYSSHKYLTNVCISDYITVWDDYVKTASAY
jgi:hypothetical protein